MSELQTPPEGTEQEPVIPKIDPEPAAPAQPLEPPVDPEPAPSEPGQPAPDYRQKFVDSQREAILLAEREKLAKTRIEQLTNKDTPTDEAMRKLYPEWDNLDNYNKSVLIRTETTAMRTANVEAQQADIVARQKLEDQLDDVIENPDYAPKLKGKESEFKKFARNPKNRGIAADTLARAFLFDAEEPAPTPMREALPAGSGGPRGDLKPQKITLEEAAEIRKTDYRRYMELVKAGQIEEL